jgi:hypothetical protein
MPSRLEPGLGDGGVANSGVCELVVLRTSQGVAMSKGQFGSATDAVAKHSMMTHPYGGPHLPIAIGSWVILTQKAPRSPINSCEKSASTRQGSERDTWTRRQAITLVAD